MKAENHATLVTYTDEVVLREATRGDVVLKQLLGEVLVHLGRFMGIHCVPEGLVQVYKHKHMVKISPLKTQRVPSQWVVLVSSVMAKSWYSQS